MLPMTTILILFLLSFHNLCQLSFTTGDSYFNDYQDVIYDLRCQSDPLRVTKHVRAFGLACCASTERYAALIMSDGRILIWSLMTVEHHPTTTSNSLSHVVLTPLYSPGFSHCDDFEIVPPAAASATNKAMIKTSLADMICQPELKGEVGVHQQGRGVLFKFVLTGFMSGIAAVPTVIRMCPPLTTKNLQKHKPLVAIGGYTCTLLIQLCAVTSGCIAVIGLLYLCMPTGHLLLLLAIPNICAAFTAHTLS